MKNRKPVLLCAALALAAIIPANAQTNTPPSSGPEVVGIYSSFTNILNTIAEAKDWTLVGGYGRSLTGSRHIAFEDVAYHFNDNVGLLFGFDQLWADGISQNNTVRGGISLSVPVHPFGFLGSTALTNVIGSPFIADCISTGVGDDSVGNILVCGINFDIYKVANFEVVGGAFYEKRSGQAEWSGAYVCGFLGISRRF